MSSISDMNPAIIAAIIGAAGSILAAFVSLHRGQRKFRNESTEQHGVLYDLVSQTYSNTTEIRSDLMEVKGELRKHLAEHEEIVFIDEVPPVRKKPSKKAQ